jgi:cation diffusion facilitator family transporter
MTAEIETIKVERVGLYSLLVNLLLVLLKLGLATLSGSLALAADSAHSLVDVFASLAVLAGLSLSKRKSKAFPYGLYKVENVVSIIIALLIFLAGYEIAREALLSSERALVVNPWLVGGVILTIVIPLLFGQYEIGVGRESNSPSLIADGRHFQTDVFSSVAVLVSIVAGYLGLTLDRIAAGVIVLFILKAGWELLVDGMRVLLDASLDVETLAEVLHIIEAQPSVTEVKWITGRNSGRYRFLETEITLRIHDLEKAHAISRQIEAQIHTQIPHVDRVLIHYEPPERTHIRYAVPLADTTGTISPHLGEAPYFALVTLRVADGMLERQEVVANPHKDVERAKGLRVAEWLVEQKVDVVIVERSLKGKGPEYVFADAGVEVTTTQARTISDALQRHQEGFGKEAVLAG